MSLKKLPAEKVWTKRQIPPATWNIIYGEYKESLRLCFLPADEKENMATGLALSRRYKSKSCIQGKNVKRYYIRRSCWFQKVMLDFDLVSLYRSETKRLKESNKSNPGKNQRKR